MKPEISNDILYIGVDDTDIDLFESQYPVPDGVSYNSYVILDEKVVVMDTVDARATDAWLANLKAALNGRTIDYLVISHLEPDHAANIGRLAGHETDRKPENIYDAPTVFPYRYHRPSGSCNRR